MPELKFRAATERTISIDLPDSDGLRITGVLRGELTMPLVVMVHGRPSSADSLLMYLGARLLYEQGFASLRLNMYGHDKQARDQFDCTLDTYVKDFDTVVKSLRTHGADHIYAVGHSYGGLTILTSQSRLTGAVLWDPSHGLAWQKPIADVWLTGARKQQYEDTVVIYSGPGMIVSVEADTGDYALGDSTNRAAGKGYPLKVISADRTKGIITELGQSYVDAADEPKAFHEIKGAGHGFTESDAVMMELMEETGKWFKGIEDGTIKKIDKEFDKKAIPTKILWVDLEMTGLDPEEHVIIEVAAEITDFNMVTLASYESLVLQSEEKLTRMNPWAQAQHDASGLTERVRAEGKPERDVVHELVGFIKAQFGNEPAILGGNSIHNDRIFIRKWWPEVEDLLHYRMLDVSSWKIYMQGRYGVQFAKKDTHRAFDDIQASIAELQYYVEWFKTNGPA